MNPGSASRRQPEPEINVTPLVDVMLVLLIIFMVIAPTLAEGADIQLPTIFAVDEQPKDLEPIDVALLKNGGAMLEKAAVEPALLETKVRELHAKDPKRRVMLKADTQVNYKRVRETFKMLQGVGFHGVALRVAKRDRAGES
ncbi:MAG: biopolymer transporter ExbD [Myxococcales bacterium]|nr:biopolymer transporter ExbD [Myxococcales bacterium]